MEKLLCIDPVSGDDERTQTFYYKNAKTFTQDAETQAAEARAQGLNSFTLAGVYLKVDSFYLLGSPAPICRSEIITLEEYFQSYLVEGDCPK